MSARTSLLLLVAAIISPALAQSPDRLPITADQVARALAGTGIATTAASVSLPPRVVAAVPDPALNVISIEPPPQRQPDDHSPSRARVRLACVLPTQCLPFYALVAWPKATRLVPSANVTVIANKTFTMRAGAQAILILDDHRSHIQVAVVSLENGMAGQRIRVASPDHKQFYLGEVVNANLLRGSF
jgi:hypothetical protein